MKHMDKRIRKTIEIIRAFDLFESFEYMNNNYNKTYEKYTLGLQKLGFTS